jgi:hypothetical protein
MKDEPMPTTGTDPTGLPLRCYARHPTTDETIMLVRGQLGFWPAGTTLAPEKLNADLADQPTAAQAQAMLTGSMFGWHVPGADPSRMPATRYTVPSPKTGPANPPTAQPGENAVDPLLR